MSWNMDEALEYYRRQGAPGDQPALISFLKELQQENGGRLPTGRMAYVAQALGTKESLLTALIRRIPSLHPDGIHSLLICGGPNCSKNRALAEFVRKTWGDGTPELEIRYVPCMRLCGKGPNIRWDGQLYHQATPELLQKLTAGTVPASGKPRTAR